VPGKHPLRLIRRIVNDVLAAGRLALLSFHARAVSI
jgi:hypothetical protein